MFQFLSHVPVYIRAPLPQGPYSLCLCSPHARIPIQTPVRFLLGASGSPAASKLSSSAISNIAYGVSCAAALWLQDFHKACPSLVWMGKDCLCLVMTALSSSLLILALSTQAHSCPSLGFISFISLTETGPAPGVRQTVKISQWIHQ